jgi:hypothetical protein
MMSSDDLRHHGKVVGDVERGHTGVVDRILDRGQHVDLRRHVERGGRLVEDDQVGFRAERHGGHGALQLAARDLVREALAEVFGVRQAELLEQLDGALLGVRTAHGAVQQRSLDDLVHQAVGGVEGRRRRLRDVTDLPCRAACGCRWGRLSGCRGR